MADVAFTAPGSTIWTCPANVRRGLVECYGGGGGGAGGHVTSTGGGGAGGTYAASEIELIPGEDYDITVGLGGLSGPGGVALPGGLGGFSQFAPVDEGITDATVTGEGGGGAGGFTPVEAMSPGLGNDSNSAGDITIAGADGSSGATGGLPGGMGGSGGGDLGGDGGAGGTFGSPTSSGLPYGGGGGGGWQVADGGAGAPGAVFITFLAVDGPVVRMFPRDDGRGMSSAPRIWPAPKGRSRVIGGYQ